MKLFSKISLAALVASAALIAIPAVAHDGVHDGFTHQAPASATVSATATSDGYTISWTDPLQVSAIEIYYGHGTRAGYVSKVNVGAAKAVRVPANATRFNFVTTNGQYLHLECGGNDQTSMPTLKGVSVDCSYLDGTGHAAGALVINGS
jgi:hypothetical protein